MTAKTFKTVVTSDNGGGLYIPIPFDPDQLWGEKPRHHVNGWVNGIEMRGAIVRTGENFRLPMGPGWWRDSHLKVGDKLAVTLAPEGPQRNVLAPDIATALEDEHEAAAFFDGLAQFYRKGYLRWIDATKKNPDERARRIAEVVKLLKSGVKERT